MSTSQPLAAPSVPHLIDGRQVIPTAAEQSRVYNPATGEIIAVTPYGGRDEVDQAVQAAHEAFASWSVLPPTRRAEILLGCRAHIAAHREDLAQLICQENGKTRDEARGDVTRGLEVLDFACGIPHLLKGESLPQVAEQIDGITTREPLGVCVGITPFNFPVMVPMWMFPLAIACGNAFVLKPSDKVPQSANRLVQLFHEAGLPPGVLNVVHGQRDTVQLLCAHPLVRSISFVGSTPVARAVYEMGTRFGKRVQAAGGAKNVLLVMPDADLDSTLRAVMGSAFGCAGQRCMAGSLLMGIGHIAEPFRERLLDAMHTLKLGDPLGEEGIGMGPVIDQGARDRLFEVIEQESHRDGQLARDGREQLPARGFFVGPTLFDQVSPDERLFGQELFGPVLSMLHPRSLDEAIQCLNRLPYGNGATIFTSSGAAAREFARRIQCGMVGVNIGVPAPMAVFSFSGWGESFFGDLHVQGMEGVHFFTRQKVVLSRWDAGYVRQHGW